MDYVGPSREPIMIDEDKPHSVRKMSISRTAVVIVSATLLVIGLGVGLGLGLKNEQPTTQKSCFKKFQRVDNQHHINETSIGRCPSLVNLQCPKGKSQPPLIVVSLDGFRAEYLLRNMTPNLEFISSCGVHAPFMRATFPTKTFPNHYTIATGLYTESHGIIDNFFYDLDGNRTFRLSTEEVFNKRWYRGEPIWNTALKSGKKVLSMMWPGSSVDVQDMRPDACYDYDRKLGLRGRVEEVLTYFDTEDASTHPDLVLIYLEQPDSAGHEQGPYGEWVQGNLTLMDNLIGTLVNGIMDKGYKDCVNFIVVADHGMDRADCSKAVNISEYLDPNQYFVYGGFHSRLSSKYLMDGKNTFYPNPKPVPLNETLSKLSCTTYNGTKNWHVRAHAKKDLPKRYHYSNSPNIDEVVLDIQPGFVAGAFPSKCNIKMGGHGSDNTFGSMHAIFVGMGSSLKQKLVEPFENIELYNLFADLLTIKPSPNNGTYGRLHFLMKGIHKEPVVPDPNTVKYKSCPPPKFVTDRIRLRNISGFPPISPSCFSGQKEEKLDEKLILTEPEILESLVLNLPLEFPGSNVAGSCCELIQKDFISSFNPQFHMPLWTSFTIFHGNTSNVLNKDWLSDKNANKSCVRADVRTNEMLNYSQFQNDKLGIKRAFLFPPGFTKLHDDISSSHISSNVVPMYEDFEKGVWMEMLHLAEEYSEKYEKLNVLVGPVFDQNADGLADSWRDVVEFVDEEKQVAIPTHYFVILTRCEGEIMDSKCLESFHTISFLLPHVRDPGNCWDSRVDNYLRENVARVRDIELVTGLTFLNGIRDSEIKMRQLTFLAEELWPRLSWFDVEPDTCPTFISDPKKCKNQKFPLLLISLDGFKPDYLLRNLTPTLERLYKCGATHSSMTSVYPSMTFPNHFSIMTGLYPESHGIVDNKMFDVSLKESFFLDAPSSLKPDWWNAEPLWSRVIVSNKTAMVLYWPGSDAEIKGRRPTDYEPYAENAPSWFRVGKALKWLGGQKADMVAIYFSLVDNAGHDGGPDSLQVNESLVEVDRSMRDLMDGIYKMDMHRCINVVVVSDHGMARISADTEVHFKKLLHEKVLEKVYIYETASPRISTRYSGEQRNMTFLEAGNRVSEKDILRNLTCKIDTMVPYLKKDSPKRFHYSNNDRIDEVLLFLDEPWVGVKNFDWTSTKGYHGWDPLYESMKALFIGWGPSFKDMSHHNESFENIELYNLLTHLLGIDPAPNNGTWGSLHHLLRDPPDNLTPPPSLNLPKYYEINNSCPFPGTDEELEEASNYTLYGCSNSTYNYKKLNRTSSEMMDLEKKHLRHGKPSFQLDDPTHLCLLHQPDFVATYHKQLKLPVWSAFRLMAPVENLNWSFSKFVPDVRIPPANQLNCSQMEELWNNISYVPLFHPILSQNDSDDALLLTNIVPMHKSFLQDIWAEVLKKLFHHFPNGYFIAGPIFDQNGDGIADSLTVYDLPSHYFIIALSSSSVNPNFETASFVFPNSFQSSKEQCEKYFSVGRYMSTHKARMRDVEILTGLKFLTADESWDTVRIKTYITTQSFE